MAAEATNIHTVSCRASVTTCPAAASAAGIGPRSGGAGGIAAVVPNVMGLCVWSPGLDEKGNSLRGRYALHRFTRMTGLSVFQATG